VLAVVALGAAGTTLGARFLTEGDAKIAGSPKSTPASTPAPKPKPEFRAYPDEIRGVHVTMALASLDGKIDEYLSLTKDGLTALELDVKDENGEVGFLHPVVPLARDVGASQGYYDPRAVARKAHAAGLYLIGRVVVFQDPVLASARPDLAVRTTGGAIWATRAGLAWVNPYDRRVWQYAVSVAEAAANAGFDEIQFDYVRFPSDGDVSLMRFPGPHPQPKNATVPAFLRYAASRLHPLGVRVSADVFGLSATHELGIGQHPARLAKVVDAIYPMTYPSHYNSGEYNLDDPNAAPGTTVMYSLRDFRRELAGGRALLVPWLQDFSLGRTYTLADVQAQIRSAREAYTGGFMLWNAEGLYTPEALRGGAPPPLPELPAPQL